MSINTGGIIILKFDETDNPSPKDWMEMYDPDIDKIIGNDSLPSQIWRPADLQKRPVMEACGVIDRNLDENSRIAAFSNLQFDIFRFILWSKEKFS